MKVILLVLLGIFGAVFALVWGRAVRRAAAEGPVAPTLGQAVLGFGTNFFDTLGIGSFAPTASVFRLARMVPDRLIPGTMNVGHTLPVVVMAVIFISAVDVEMTTLITLITAAVAGAWLGADLVSRLAARPIRLIVGLALFVAAGLMAAGQLGIGPSGGMVRGLDGWRLVGATVGCFVLGALNTMGIGLYGPCLIMIALLGMNPIAAFPIMMGACAFLMTVGSARFVRRDSYALRPAIGLTLGGIPAVLVAAFIVKSLPLDVLRWLVVAVALGTAGLMLHAFLGGRDTES